MLSFDIVCVTGGAAVESNLNFGAQFSWEKEETWGDIYITESLEVTSRASGLLPVRIRNWTYMILYLSTRPTVNHYLIFGSYKGSCALEASRTRSTRAAKS